MNSITNALHDVTHRVAGVPEHDDSANASHAPDADERHGRHARHGRVIHRAHAHTPVQHHRRAPRVFVAWQNRIAAIFTR